MRTESYINNKESDKKHQYLFGHNLKIVISLILLGPGKEVLFWSLEHDVSTDKQIQTQEKTRSKIEELSRKVSNNEETKRIF